jgi:uncharacterized protein
MKPLLRRFLFYPLTRIAIAIAMVVGAIVTVQLAVRLFHLPKPFDPVIGNAFGAAAGIGAYWIYVHYIERREMSEYARSGAARELVAGLAFGALLFGAVVGTLTLLGSYHVSAFQWINLFPALIACLATGFFEETLLRGIVFRIIEEWLGTWIALAISALIFGLLHLVNPHATVLGAVSIIFEAGIMLACAYIYTRRLWLAIGIHAAWNFVQGSVFGIAVSGTDSHGLFTATLTGPEWLSGGEFGAEASIVAVIFGVIAAGLLLRGAISRNHVKRRSPSIAVTA